MFSDFHGCPYGSSRVAASIRNAAVEFVELGILGSMALPAASRLGRLVDGVCQRGERSRRCHVVGNSRFVGIAYNGNLSGLDGERQTLLTVPRPGAALPGCTWSRQIRAFALVGRTGARRRWERFAGPKRSQGRARKARQHAQQQKKSYDTHRRAYNHRFATFPPGRSQNRVMAGIPEAFKNAHFSLPRLRDCWRTVCLTLADAAARHQPSRPGSPTLSAALRGRGRRERGGLAPVVNLAGSRRRSTSPSFSGVECNETSRESRSRPFRSLNVADKCVTPTPSPNRRCAAIARRPSAQGRG